MSLAANKSMWSQRAGTTLADKHISKRAVTETESLHVNRVHKWRQTLFYVMLSAPLCAGSTTECLLSSWALEWQEWARHNSPEWAQDLYMLIHHDSLTQTQQNNHGAIRTPIHRLLSLKRTKWSGCMKLSGGAQYAVEPECQGSTRVHIFVFHSTL